MQGATDAELGLATARMKELEALKENEELMAKAQALTEKYITPQEQLTKTQQELEAMFMKGAISVEVYQKALADAEKQANKDYTANFGVTGVDAVAAGSAEAMARLNEYSSRTATQGMIAANHSWQANPSDSVTNESIAQDHPWEDNGQEAEEQLVRIYEGIMQLVGFAGSDANKPTIEVSAADLRD
jgi:hypothetical protein